MNKNSILIVVLTALIGVGCAAILLRDKDQAKNVNVGVVTSQTMTISTADNITTIRSAWFHFTWPLPANRLAAIRADDAYLGAMVDVFDESAKTVAEIRVYPNTLGSQKPSTEAFRLWLLAVKQPPAPFIVDAVELGTNSGYKTTEPTSSGTSQPALYAVGVTHIYSISSKTLTSDQLVPMMNAIQIDN